MAFTTTRTRWTLDESTSSRVLYSSYSLFPFYGGLVVVLREHTAQCVELEISGDAGCEGHVWKAWVRTREARGVARSVATRPRPCDQSHRPYVNGRRHQDLRYSTPAGIPCSSRPLDLCSRQYYGLPLHAKQHSNRVVLFFSPFRWVTLCTNKSENISHVQRDTGEVSLYSFPPVIHSWPRAENFTFCAYTYSSRGEFSVSPSVMKL